MKFSCLKHSIIAAFFVYPISAEAPAPAPLAPEQRIEIYQVVLAHQQAKIAALEAQFRLMQANERLAATLAKYRRDGWRLTDTLDWEKEK